MLNKLTSSIQSSYQYPSSIYFIASTERKEYKRWNNEKSAHKKSFAFFLFMFYFFLLLEIFSCTIGRYMCMMMTHIDATNENIYIHITHSYWNCRNEDKDIYEKENVYSVLALAQWLMMMMIVNLFVLFSFIFFFHLKWKAHKMCTLIGTNKRTNFCSHFFSTLSCIRVLSVFLFHIRDSFFFMAAVFFACFFHFGRKTVGHRKQE